MHQHTVCTSHKLAENDTVTISVLIAETYPHNVLYELCDIVHQM